MTATKEAVGTAYEATKSAGATVVTTAKNNPLPTLLLLGGAYYLWSSWNAAPRRARQDVGYDASAANRYDVTNRYDAANRYDITTRGDIEANPERCRGADLGHGEAEPDSGGVGGRGRASLSTMRSGKGAPSGGGSRLVRLFHRFFGCP